MKNEEKTKNETVVFKNYRFKKDRFLERKRSFLKIEINWHKTPTPKTIVLENKDRFFKNYLFRKQG